MKNWKEIQLEIWEALSDFQVAVEYHQKIGAGKTAQCSYFTISIQDDSEWEWNDILGAVSDVCEKWNLELDSESGTGDFDLNVNWDINE